MTDIWPIISYPSVPVALVGLLRACEGEARAAGAELSEPQLDALTRALYPHVDEADATRRRYDEACKLLQSVTDRLERERDRVCAADACTCEAGAVLSGRAATAVAEVNIIGRLVAEHPAARGLAGRLSDCVREVFDALQKTRDENLLFRRGNEEWAEKVRLLAAERDALMRWPTTARQVATMLAPYWPTSTPLDEHNVIWLVEKIIEHIDDLRDATRRLSTERDHAVQALATAHHGQQEISSHTVHEATRSMALRPLLLALVEYIGPSGTTVPVDVWHALQDRYTEAQVAGLLAGLEG